MWYIIPREQTLSEAFAESPEGFNDLASARAKADAMHKSFGKHYQVIKLQTVWSTMTLGDLLEEDRALVRNRNMIREV